MPGRWLSAIVLLLIGISTAKAGNTALVSIVIDDLGYNHALARQALDLPGPVSYSILPELPDSASLARIAREKHRDVLLHIPMQAVGGQAMGPGGLSIDMNDAEIRNIVEADLATVPEAVGISNHMGSAFTSDLNAMRLFMGDMKNHGNLFFLDSLTTNKTKARSVAMESGVPLIARDVFLDNERTPEALEAQFNLMLRIAEKYGRALAIAHPYPETLEFLEQRLHSLKNGPVRLVPISLLIKSSQKEKHYAQGPGTTR
jgi:polysaccharide deacetylase 2 family uncharacterized protein YibQ